MEKKSGIHQLRLVVVPIIFRVFIHPNGGWPWDFWTITEYVRPSFPPGMLEADEAGIEALCYSSLRQVELNHRAATLGGREFFVRFNLGWNHEKIPKNLQQDPLNGPPNLSIAICMFLFGRDWYLLYMEIGWSNSKFTNENVKVDVILPQPIRWYQCWISELKSPRNIFKHQLVWWDTNAYV